ncbi:hypothetical protein SNEBB_000764 [Seison nebaliae]|nr:hypothetical protein SNEBB_000764 [Seison nebaliae]
MNRNWEFGGRNDSFNNFDKFREHRDNSTLGKIERTYWTTKQKLRQKVGKQDDNCIVESDKQLDAKLEHYYSVEGTCKNLIHIVRLYENSIYKLAQEENELGRFLKSYSTDNASRVEKMMMAVGRSMSFASQQRIQLQGPLMRLSNEVDTFRSQAVGDTRLTVKRMEECRSKYRGSLLWMKEFSEQLDPDAARKLDKFRRIQSQVKSAKNDFDKMKVDTIQKIELLTASRCNMFSHVIAGYQEALLIFWERTARTMEAVADTFTGYHYYDYKVVKDLRIPSKELSELNNEEIVNDEKVRESIKNDDDDDDEMNLIDMEIKEIPKIEVDIESLNELTQMNKNDSLTNLFEKNTDDESNEAIDRCNALIDLFENDLKMTEGNVKKELDDVKSNKRNKEDKNDGNDVKGSDFLFDWLNEEKSDDNPSEEIDKLFDSTISPPPDDLLGLDVAKNEDEDADYLPSWLMSEQKTQENNPMNGKMDEKKNISEKKSWLDSFAALDPLANPDKLDWAHSNKLKEDSNNNEV